MNSLTRFSSFTSSLVILSSYIFLPRYKRTVPRNRLPAVLEDFSRANLIFLKRYYDPFIVNPTAHVSFPDHCK
jgi:hypothetical protein